MIERYSRKEIKKIWNEENKYKICLDIEILAAQAMEKYNYIPKGVASKVRKKAIVNIDRIHKIESKNAFVACRNTNCEISKATAFSICESCEMVDEISDAKLTKYLSSFNDKKGTKYKRFNLEFFGLCKRCK